MEVISDPLSGQPLTTTEVLMLGRDLRAYQGQQQSAVMKIRLSEH
jgi:hypothetical protein